MEYKVIHSVYKAQWGEIVTLEEIQTKTSLDFERAKSLISSLEYLGWLTLVDNQPDMGVDTKDVDKVNPQKVKTNKKKSIKS